MILSKNYLKKLKSNNLLKLSEFVVNENYQHHTNNVIPKTFSKEVRNITAEELLYSQNAEVFVAQNFNGNIIGSIRILKWDFKTALPIQKIFGINPLLALRDKSISHIYHIGRFAISKASKDINLFKKLMLAAIDPVCQSEGGIVFAEIDSKLLRVIRLLGIDAKVIGDSVNYLGSETIPISITKEGFLSFYKKNKNLLRLVKEELGVDTLSTASFKHYENFENQTFFDSNIGNHTQTQA